MILLFLWLLVHSTLFYGERNESMSSLCEPHPKFQVPLSTDSFTDGVYLFAHRLVVAFNQGCCLKRN